MRAFFRDQTSTMQEILDLLTRLRDAREPCAIATVVETRGSVSARTGSKALIDRQGRVVAGWVGGGCAQSTVCHAAIESLQEGEPRVVDLDLDDEVLGTGMPCGGAMRVYVEPMIPKPRLWLLGHGRVAECLCQMGALLGFDVIVSDPMAERERYPEAARLIDDDLDYEKLAPGAADYVIVATQHKGDHQSMLRALRSPAPFIALIASRKRSGLVLDYLRKEGIAEPDLSRVHAPAGLDLGAKAPEEIALSVLSEIVLHRRRGSGKAMRERLEKRALKELETASAA
jgi:xanthine dehydrogenase accessory factor